MTVILKVPKAEVPKIKINVKKKIRLEKNIK